MNNIVIANVKFILIDIIGDFVYWPIWWYTVGLKNVLVWFSRQVKNLWLVLAIGLWLKSMFVPMYADRSILGRGISFVMRIIILACWKLPWFIAWTAVTLIVVIIWIVAPLGAVYMIYLNFKV